jgi:predicted dehydrogenase
MNSGFYNSGLRKIIACSLVAVVACFAGVARAADGPLSDESVPLRVGVIGLDTSHSIAFTKAMNATPGNPAMRNCRVVVAYPYGSKDLKESNVRIPGYTEEIQKLGVKIADSIDDLLKEVDAVLLETNDGNPRLEQMKQVLAAGKPVFMDKPVAADLADVLAIYAAAKDSGVPVFSSSSLRFAGGVQEARNGEFGKVLGCETYSPCSLEPTHTDLYWYGIHGVEMLYTCMGTGCESVTRTSTDGFDVVVGTWADGRIGTFRGIRQGKSGYGGTVFGEKAVAPIGPYKGYDPLVVEIAKFFRTHEAPVSVEETVELYAFMTAADESKRQGGVPVAIADVISKATAASK